MNCPQCGCEKLANENTHGVWLCGTKGWPYCSGAIESVQCLRNQLAAMTAERDALRLAITRGGLDLSPCSGCGETVACLPDGMPYCEACAKKLED